jgi:multiple antibiotic resistance protein
MDRIWTTDMLEQFLFGFGTLFAIINPYGLSFVFLNRTLALSEAERRIVARRVALFAFGILIVSLFAGSEILRFFGISLPALRIGGGLVVAASGWVMLHEPVHEDGHVASTHSMEAVDRMTFFPLTIPLTTGPGTIAAAIAIDASRPAVASGFVLPSLTSVLIAMAVALTILHAYRHAGAMARLFGREGTHVVTRLSAFLLLCVGVQIILTGTSDALRSSLSIAH